MINLPPLASFKTHLAEIFNREKQDLHRFLAELKKASAEKSEAEIIQMLPEFWAKSPLEHATQADFEALLPLSLSKSTAIREAVIYSLKHAMPPLKAAQIETLYQICPTYKKGPAYRLYCNHPDLFTYLPLKFYLANQPQSLYRLNQLQIDCLATYRDHQDTEMRYLVWTSIGRYLIHTQMAESIARLSDPDPRLRRSIQKQFLEQAPLIESFPIEDLFVAMLERIQTAEQISNSEIEKDIFSDLDIFYRQHQERLLSNPDPAVQAQLEKIQRLTNALLDSDTHLKSTGYLGNPNSYSGLIPTTFEQAEQALANIRANPYPEISDPLFDYLKQWPPAHRPLLRQLVSPEFPLEPLGKWMELLPDLDLLKVINEEWFMHHLSKTRIAAIQTYQHFGLRIPDKYIQRALTHLSSQLQDQSVEYLAKNTHWPHRELKAELFALLYRDQNLPYYWVDALINTGAQPAELLSYWKKMAKQQEASAVQTERFIEALFNFEISYERSQQDTLSPGITTADWLDLLVLDPVKSCLLKHGFVSGINYSEGLKQALKQELSATGWQPWLKLAESASDWPIFLKLHDLAELVLPELIEELWQHADLNTILTNDNIYSFYRLIEKWETSPPGVFNQAQLQDLRRACIQAELSNETNDPTLSQALLQDDQGQDYRQACQSLAGNPSETDYSDLIYLEQNEIRDAIPFLFALQTKCKPGLRWGIIYLLMQWGALRPAESEADKAAFKNQFPVLFWDMLGVGQPYSHDLPTFDLDPLEKASANISTILWIHELIYYS